LETSSKDDSNVTELFEKAFEFAIQFANGEFGNDKDLGF
jgi:hypothetical protein